MRLAPTVPAAAAIVWLCLALPAAAEPTVSRPATELPRAWTESEATQLAAALGAATLPVRVHEPQPKGSRPKELLVDGVATLLRLPNETDSVLVVPYALVSRAGSVEVWQDGDWVPASVEHGTLLFDLARLIPQRAIPATALPVAAGPGADPVYFAAAPVTPSGSPAPVPVAMGAPQPEELSFYGRASTTLSLGYPLIDRQRAVRGLLSTPSPDGIGMLLIGAEQILAWHEAWERLDGTAGLRPKMVSQSQRLTTPGRP